MSREKLVKKRELQLDKFLNRVVFTLLDKDGAEGVRLFLRGKGIKGTPFCAHDCPVALYIRNRFEVQFKNLVSVGCQVSKRGVRVVIVDVVCNEREMFDLGRTFSPIPDIVFALNPVSSFIVRFDAKQYMELLK